MNLMPASRRVFLKSAAALGAVSSSLPNRNASGALDRQHWIGILRRLADPVLLALQQRRLHVAMPVEAPRGNAAERREFTHLEALGRLLAGMAPWFEAKPVDPHEDALRAHYAELAREAIAAAVDPASPDFMNFTRGEQPLVDAAFLAQAVLRAPVELWSKLPSSVKEHFVNAIGSTRTIRPGFNNWLLFSAMIEAALCFAGRPWDSMRVDYAVRQVDEWYKGDGAYGDGPSFHWDYYNSFVIYPMLIEVLEAVAQASSAWNSFHATVLERAQRYAAVQERWIGPDGSFPPIGRSLAYRCGAFHLLALMALRKQLPETITPPQVRCGLTAVIRRTLEAPGTFDPNGWLLVGLCGHQPALAERYISTGSLYLCSTAFLPLGLPVSDPFWSAPDQPWSQKRAWSGQSIAPDHAISA
jgi:hypothetical protein